MEREKKVHGETHTETCKLRGTHTLRETPSSRKRHALLRARHTHTRAHTHTHTLREINIYKECEAHTHTLRETHKHTEGDTH